MENQVVNTNSDVKNLQTLSMIFHTHIENCISSTDWENKQQAQREKEKLYSKIMKATNQVFSRIGGYPSNGNQQNDNQQVTSDPQQKDNNAKNVNGTTEEMTDNTVINQNTNSSTPQNVSLEAGKQLKDDQQLFGNRLYQRNNQQESQSDKPNIVSVNKSEFEEEPNYCQKVVINAHPFKQRLANQQQRAQQEAKEKQNLSEDDYNPDHSSDSDFRSSDEDYSGKKKKPIHKKRNNGYGFSYNQYHTQQQSGHQPRPRGRPPNFNPNDNGALSIQVASQSEQKKVLNFFNEHYDPQKRNKIHVINQITKFFNYSYSSVYYLVSKQLANSDSEFADSNYKPHKQHKSPNQFQSQLQRQQQQQHQYYQSQINNSSSKSDHYSNGYRGYGSSSQIQHNEMQKRNPTYQDQYKQQMRENKSMVNDRYAQNLINQQNPQNYNQQMYRKNQGSSQYQSQGNSHHHYQQNNYYNQEMSQTESDSGVAQNPNLKQTHVDADEDLFQGDQVKPQQYHFEQKQLEQRRFSEQTQDPSNKVQSNNNRVGSSENRPNPYNDYHRSVSSRDTIQIQQQQEA